MSDDGLNSAHDYLRDAARARFVDQYGGRAMHVNKPLGLQLQWVPALRFTLHKHIHVFVEPSDGGPYPLRLAMLYTEASNYPEPIAIYSVCHEAAMETVDGRRDRKRLKAHGFGLVTVDANGDAKIELAAIPIVQVISDAVFKERIKGLPTSMRRPIGEAFDDYRLKPVNGVKTLSEIVEGMITKAGKDSARRGDISKAASKKDAADILDALHAEYRQARAAIGGARKFIKECRNLVHHQPKTKKAAYQKYTLCREHFLEGLYVVQSFRTAMKNVGLTGGLART